MKIIKNKSDLKKLIKDINKLGFVPTMGALHLGHKSLVKKSVFQCDKTIVTIFVNKPQFNKSSDYKTYPINLKKDIKMLRKLKVDYLYLPTFKQVYPNGVSRKIKIHPFSKKLCGKNRPGHFTAVVNVIDKFIKIINPTNIYFGEKDFQQFKIVENFVKKNHNKIKIIKCKTIREKNGIAFSSRNLLLNFNEKEIASKVYKLIKLQKRKLIKNKYIIKNIKKKIYFFGVKKIDYLEVLNINKLIKPFNKEKKYKIFIAYYIGNIRLIDNI